MCVHLKINIKYLLETTCNKLIHLPGGLLKIRAVYAIIDMMVCLIWSVFLVLLLVFAEGKIAW